MRPRAALVITTVIGGACFSTPALADVDDYESSYQPPKAQTRSDFTLGLELGVVVGGGSGYPNEPDKIDNSAFEQSSGVGVGNGGAFWLGGALRDWYVFGLGLAMRNTRTGELDSVTTSFIVHNEFYPLFAKGGVWRDLGLIAEFGAGGGFIARGKEHVADGGALSTVGLGVVYEPWQFGSFRAGPVLEYTHQFSQSIAVDLVLAGMKISFYGGPG
jgi:hypothetical protein